MPRKMSPCSCRLLVTLRPNNRIERTGRKAARPLMRNVRGLSVRLSLSFAALRSTPSVGRAASAALASCAASLSAYLTLASASSVCVAPGCSTSVARSRSRLAALGLDHSLSVARVARSQRFGRFASPFSGTALRGTPNISVERIAFGARSLQR